jgi:hypothetical protein
MRRFLRPELLLLLVPILYVATLAQTLVFGDPTEYTFVANVLGIAHPPGYAFITLLGKLFQSLVPFGEIPWRMHLLSAFSATTAVLFVYGIIRAFEDGHPYSIEVGRFSAGALAGVFAALSIAFGADFWQHAIHANPHNITATFLAANLYFLTRWWAAAQGSGQEVGWTNSTEKITVNHQGDRWLLIFSFSAGLGITHHPLTVFSFPAYALFILLVRPGIWREWRLLLKMISLALLGLAVWLYFPIRSAMGPPVGPTSMNTLDGFLDHVLGRGITEALPYYALHEQWDRARVFWSILRLQYTLPVIFLAVLTVLWPLISRTVRHFGNMQFFPTVGKPWLLYILALLCNYAFVISLKVQDIMAYLLGPLLVVGLLAGLGLYFLLLNTQRALKPGKIPLALLVGALFLIGPFIQVVRNLQLISLREYNEGYAYVEAVFSKFAGRGEGAVLLNDWEHMTPLWYTQLVEERWPDASDVRPEFVSTARPWVEFVYDFLPGGPVYLSNYRRDVVDAGFRLRPFGPFYQVVEPGDTSIPEELIPIDRESGEVEIIAYELPQRDVEAGTYVPLTLAMRSPSATADYYVPVLTVGDLSFPFTTDSHLVTPQWQPGEVVVERFDFALPHNLPPGEYPLTIGLKNLSRDKDAGENFSLPSLQVTEANNSLPISSLLANFRQRVGLDRARASQGAQTANAPWPEPLRARPGDTIHLTLDWRSIDYAEESYTVFVHLIDEANQPIVTLDYTPLGGAAPTHLWIPKWLPGQRYVDPYQLTIPEDLAPGNYLIEVGLYEMVGKRRLHISDEAGNLVGDRYILGRVVVE